MFALLGKNVHHRDGFIESPEIFPTTSWILHLQDMIPPQRFIHCTWVIVSGSHYMGWIHCVCGSHYRSGFILSGSHYMGWIHCAWVPLHGVDSLHVWVPLQGVDSLRPIQKSFIELDVYRPTDISTRW